MKAEDSGSGGSITMLHDIPYEYPDIKPRLLIHFPAQMEAFRLALEELGIVMSRFREEINENIT